MYVHRHLHSLLILSFFGKFSFFFGLSRAFVKSLSLKALIRLLRQSIHTPITIETSSILLSVERGNKMQKKKHLSLGSQVVSMRLKEKQPYLPLAIIVLCSVLFFFWCCVYLAFCAPEQVWPNPPPSSCRPGQHGCFHSCERHRHDSTARTGSFMTPPVQHSLSRC